MVDIEHGALSAFKEEGLAFIHEFIDRIGDIGEHGLDARSKGKRFIDHLIDVQRFGAQELR